MLFPAERLVALVIGAFLIADLTLVAGSAISVDGRGYGAVVSCGAVILAVGLAYRWSGRDQKIALAAIAAGLFILFTIVGAALNYLLIPVGAERIDPLLIRLDGLVGYSWPGLVGWASEHPALGTLLRWTYVSSLPQFVIVILTLGMTGRQAQLHAFLLTGVLAATLTMAFWLAFPSSGPSAYFAIPVETAERLGMVVGPDYGVELNRVMTQGAQRLSPQDALGLIAFPSFHTVMALMAVWFTRSIRGLFPVFVVINTLMLPAILIHGGHHLIDLFGGLAAFLISVWLARSVLARVSDTRQRPEPAAPAEQGL